MSLKKYLLPFVSIVAWLLVGVHLVLELKESREKHCVSYFAQTRTGWLVGFIDMEWSSKADRAGVMAYIHEQVVRKQADDHQPEIVGNITILSVFDKPWK